MTQLDSLPLIIRSSSSARETIGLCFDFADPVSYVVSTQVEGWCHEGGYAVDWIPFAADHDLDLPLRFAQARELAHEFGFPLFTRFGAPSAPALRCAVLAKYHGEVSQFVMRVFQFWYATDLPPYSDVLFDGLATDCNVEQSHMRAALDNARHWCGRALAEATADARDRGATSVPTLLLPGGEHIQIDASESPLQVWHTLRGRLREHRLSADVRTYASRCYGAEPGTRERFCRWCSCGRKPA